MKDIKPVLDKISLPASVVELGLARDVTPEGAEAFVVYLIVKTGTSLPSANTMREIESSMRAKLRDALEGREVYFRWRTSGEHRAVQRSA